MAPFLPFFVSEAAAASLAPLFEPLPFVVSEAVAPSFAPLFSLEDSLDCCFGGWGFGFFFGFLSLTSGLLPVWK